MTRRRKTLLVVLGLILLAAGGFAWYWRATAVDRQVNALLAEVREDNPGLVESWLIKLGLMKGPRTDRSYDQVAYDLAKLGPSAVPALIRALRESDWPVRCVAALALGKLGDARAIEPLIAALKDKDKNVRYSAASALGELGNARAVGLLIAALRDEDEDVRRSAARALGELGDARAVEPLKELLGDEDVAVRTAAAEALKRLRGQGER